MFTFSNPGCAEEDRGGELKAREKVCEIAYRRNKNTKAHIAHILCEVIEIVPRLFLSWF